MIDTLQKKCELFIQNRNDIKKNFGWDSAYMYPLCASIYTIKNRQVNIDQMQECKRLLKQETGILSSFRNISKLITISLLATDTNPDQKFQNALQVYKQLKNEFFSSTYLPVVALSIVDMADPNQYEEIVKRTRRIYKLMKKEHPFLTSSEDSALAALLALSKKSDAQIISETEKCYTLLKPHFFLGNPVQSLSHVLALGDDTVELKCHRTIELFKALKDAGCKYGTKHELATLGVLALLSADIETLVKDMKEVDDYLSKQKGFGIMGIGSRQRLMYASMLVTNEYIESENTLSINTAIHGTISLIIAQQAAMYAAIAASNAAATANSSTT